MAGAGSVSSAVAQREERQPLLPLPQPAPLLPRAEVLGEGLRWFSHPSAADPHALHFLAWDHRVCVTFCPFDELLDVLWAVIVLLV